VSDEQEAEIVRLLRERDEARAERDAVIEQLQALPLDGLRGAPLMRRVALTGAQRRWLAAVSSTNRYRSAWLSARRGRNLWRKLYCEATTIPGSGKPVVDRALYEKHVVTVQKENLRVWGTVHGLENELYDVKLRRDDARAGREDAEKEAERLRAELSDLRLAFSEYQGAQARSRPFGLTGCQNTTHCAHWGFCARCHPELTKRVVLMFADTDGSSDAYAEVIRKLTGTE
jgi:hypothetical protein